MLSLPEDVIVYMSQFFNVKYIYYDSDDESCEESLVNDHGSGDYYPLRNLYATCKAFKWLETYECVMMECGEFYWNILTRKITGQYHGMLYNLGSKGIIGVSSYQHGKIITENIFDSSPAGIFRYINKLEVEDDCCKPWGNKCVNDCSTCIYFDYVDKVVYNKDALIKDIRKDENGTIYLRKQRDIIQLDQQQFVLFF